MTPQTPGSRIRGRRKEMKLTQRSLAQALGISHVSVSQWERDDSEPTGKNLFSLSRVLRCSPTWILFGDEEQQPSQIDEIPRQLNEQQIQLLDLFDQLPESEKEIHLSALRDKVDDFNKLFDELLKARKGRKNI
ncbi:helix-turn-helix domain-containing protein [Serratia marcescens]|uniref:helix-turn-helix domain-containing protein n=1 Tax=Serratia marcescens TaxID=615 RepID=UPI002760C504|nr:helix-turn-helix domain-containing protein [Serratia marcescens]MDP8609664.1 helix-turn-helix domain-containing protein [Serratia marcescens]MDP8614757.1 helix-turn-helix domain-containing protein [Serratia marcescens]MDP8644813.1 helix-turn-helix domain-containing protein [Serratia marcescens]MDP8654744.1 helix-turn-helix domain-containing protein [Serratia marcescens]MDP8659707.1 helix-turn-helix domain-containing protein [Serratia marcescens]